MHWMADDVLPPQIWAVAGGNGFEPLRIDKALLERSKSKRRPKLIRSLPEAKIIARRAMEVGYLGVLQARHEPPEQIAKDFGNLETLAGNAVSALNKLIKRLEPRSADARDLARPILTAQAGLRVRRHPSHRFSRRLIRNESSPPRPPRFEPKRWCSSCGAAG
jgi:hypothetical protein